MTKSLGAQQFLLLSTYHYNDQIKEDGMGGSCSAHGGDEMCIQKFYERKSHEKIKLKRILRK